MQQIRILLVLITMVIFINQQLLCKDKQLSYEERRVDGYYMREFSTNLFKPRAPNLPTPFPGCWGRWHGP